MNSKSGATNKMFHQKIKINLKFKKKINESIALKKLKNELLFTKLQHIFLVAQSH